MEGRGGMILKATGWSDVRVMTAGIMARPFPRER
jgi:hypothetical protein